MIGDSYELFGTDTLFEITGEGKTYWVVTVRSSKGQKLGDPHREARAGRGRYGKKPQKACGDGRPRGPLTRRRTK